MSHNCIITWLSSPVDIEICCKCEERPKARLHLAEFGIKLLRLINLKWAIVEYYYTSWNYYYVADTLDINICYKCENSPKCHTGPRVSPHSAIKHVNVLCFVHWQIIAIAKPPFWVIMSKHWAKKHEYIPVKFYHPVLHQNTVWMWHMAQNKTSSDLIDFNLHSY